MRKLLLALIFISGLANAQSFTFDGSGKLKVNATGSSNVLVAVTNSITSSVGNTVALPVSNSLANPYLWISATNSTANVGNMGVTNSAGTYLWTAQTNAIPTGANVIGAVTQSGTWTVQPGNTPNTVGWLVNVTNSPSISQIGTNSGGTYIWTAITNSPAVTLGNTTVIGVTNLPSSVYWVSLTNSTANAGNHGVTNSAGTYLWTALTNNVTIANSNTFTAAQAGNWSINVTNWLQGATNIATGGGAANGGTLRTISSTDDPDVVAMQYMTNVHSVSFGLTTAAVYSNVVKSSAGRVLWFHAGNTNIQPIWVKFYNTASAFNPSTLTPLAEFVCPGNTNGAGINLVLPHGGMGFTTGIGVGATAAPATNDGTAIQANTVITVGYD